jgi:hypothetical protein
LQFTSHPSWGEVKQHGRSPAVRRSPVQKKKSSGRKQAIAIGLS